MPKNHFVSGSWNLICDICNKKIKASEAKQRWDGFIVCSEDYENRHPQDFVRAKQDQMIVPFSRPIPTEIFTTVPYILYWETGYVMEGYIDGDNI